MRSSFGSKPPHCERDSGCARENARAVPRQPECLPDGAGMLALQPLHALLPYRGSDPR